jgi:hypothetical protein
MSAAAQRARLGHEVGYLSVLYKQQSRDSRGLLNAIVPCVSNADGLTVDDARTATPFGLTGRQSHFLVAVLFTERAPKTVNNLLTTLSVVLRTAVEWGVAVEE